MDKKEFDINMGAKLRELRLSHRLSMADVALEIGVSYQQVQKYESGLNAPSVFMLEKLAGFYDTAVSVFFDPSLTRPDGKDIAPEKKTLLKSVLSLRNPDTLRTLGIVAKAFADMESNADDPERHNSTSRKRTRL